MRMRFVAVTAAVLLAACAAIRQQKQEIRADTGEFKNLKVLPPNITHDELIATMRGFSRALGTRCEHCHAENPPGSKERLDFASDKKPEKNVARTMLRMTRAVNADYLAHVNEHGQTVTCITCHLGHTVPPPPPAPPAQDGAPAPPRQ